MGKSTFNIIYVIQKGKAKADGSAPVVARITVNGEKSHFATRIYVDPACWLPKEYRTTGLTREERKVNEALDELRVLIKQRYDEMLRRAEVITAGKLKNAITGLDEKAMKLLDLCDQFIEDYKGLIEAKVYGRKTLTRYVSTRNRLSKFLAERYRLQDIPLSDINPKFAKDFDLWLRTTKRLANNTSMKFVRRLKTIYHMAVTNGWVQSDPLASVRIRMEKVDRGYLTTEELKRLQDKKFTSKRLELIRDLFLFSCYTGFGYADLKLLSSDMLRRWPDGNLWIDTERIKTHVDVHVRLLDVPLMLIQKYEGQAKSGLLFPVPSNQKINEYLKEIAALCGIDKAVTSHMARHTFATTVTLANGVPIETVSKMLGHTNIRTTQIYARIIDQKINNDMEMLAQKLNNKMNQVRTTI